ncbi:conserved hypothetical protein [delta proteobacterium NaphS2]|nr:conserved hypothetical protein [delta proteobacterium NaphS2]
MLPNFLKTLKKGIHSIIPEGILVAVLVMNYIGLVIFLTFVAYQVIRYKKEPRRKPIASPGGTYEREQRI